MLHKIHKHNIYVLVTHTHTDGKKEREGEPTKTESRGSFQILNRSITNQGSNKNLPSKEQRKTSGPDRGTDEL